ncbi:MAG: hypothetical protein ACQJCO_09725 [cyanobacterium endosymbiont of Rhopalodia sterrenbergii]
MEKSFSRVDKLPFVSKRKRMTMICKSNS